MTPHATSIGPIEYVPFLLNTVSREYLLLWWSTFPFLLDAVLPR